tara:strand:- start:5959 stop:7095 length:1137 start_codon:yes stop_codon:yes gene_type:complete
MTKARNIGSLRLRPQVIQGEETGKWFVDIPKSLTSTGKRKRRLFASRTQAEKAANGVRRKLDLRKLGFVDEAQRSVLTFNQGADDWVYAHESAVTTGNMAAKTLETRKYELKALRSFFGKYCLSDIDKRSVERYQVQRLDKGYAVRTVNSEVATFRQVLRWLQEEGHQIDIPRVRNVKGRRARPDIPTREEVVRLIGHLPKRLKPLVRMLAETGMRPGEVFNLPWRHVNEVGGYVDIAPHGDWSPKTEGSERRIWLSAGMLAEIQRLPKKGTYVFSGRIPTKPITSISKALDAAVKSAEIKRDGRLMRITAKTFRKAFATWQAEGSVHPSILQKQMGHVAGSRMTDQYYVHVRDEAVRNAYRELPFDLQERKEDRKTA